MSFETYIVFMAGDLLGLFIAVILAIPVVKIKDPSEEDRRKIKILIALIGILVIVGLGITAVYVISSRNQKIADYQQKINEAEFDLENQNYLEAAEHYDQARLIAYNEESELQAIYKKAECYFSHGRSASDLEYYRQALKIHMSILENESYKDSDHYINSAVYMSQIYCRLHREWDEPEWVEMITWLESTIEKTPNAEAITHDELSLRINVVYTLGAYYEYASSIGDNISNKDISSKAFRYYDEFVYLHGLDTAAQGEVTSTNTHTEKVLKVAKFLFDYKSGSEDTVYCIEKAIELCQTEIERLKASDVTTADYLELKKNVGKGFILLGNLFTDEETEYRSQAYQVLSPLIAMDDEDAQSALMHVGYYLVRTNLCSAQEIDWAVDIYEYNLSRISFETNASERISVLISACVSCKWIAENYSYSTKAMEAGEKFSTELMTQRYDFLTEEQRTDAKNLQNFFIGKEDQNTDDPQNATEPTEPTKPTEQQSTNGYQIAVSASRVDLYQQFIVTVIPARSDFTNIVLYAKDPSGEMWDFTLGTSTTKALYVDRLDLTGVWTIYADVTYTDGVYSGAEEGPRIHLTVETGVVGDLLNSLGT